MYKGWLLIGGVCFPNVRLEGVHILSNLDMVIRPFHQQLLKHIVITFSSLLKEKNPRTYDNFVSYKLLNTTFGTIYVKETWLVCSSRWSCLDFFSNGTQAKIQALKLLDSAVCGNKSILGRRKICAINSGLSYFFILELRLSRSHSKLCLIIASTLFLHDTNQTMCFAAQTYGTFT